VVGGIVIGSALGGLVASAWGVTAPFWFAFAGSALILALIWRSLLQIAHADEQTRSDAPPKGPDDGSTETGPCADAER
jgi:predicted MFS family arabinose efflux permease